MTRTPEEVRADLREYMELTYKRIAILPFPELEAKAEAIATMVAGMIDLDRELTEQIEGEA